MKSGLAITLAGVFAIAITSCSDEKRHESKVKLGSSDMTAGTEYYYINCDLDQANGNVAATDTAKAQSDEIKKAADTQEATNYLSAQFTSNGQEVTWHLFTHIDGKASEPFTAKVRGQNVTEGYKLESLSLEKIAVTWTRPDKSVGEFKLTATGGSEKAGGEAIADEARTLKIDSIKLSVKSMDSGSCKLSYKKYTEADATERKKLIAAADKLEKTVSACLTYKEKVFQTCSELIPSQCYAKNVASEMIKENSFSWPIPCSCFDKEGKPDKTKAECKIEADFI